MIVTMSTNNKNFASPLRSMRPESILVDRHALVSLLGYAKALIGLSEIYNDSGSHVPNPKYLKTMKEEVKKIEEDLNEGKFIRKIETEGLMGKISSLSGSQKQDAYELIEYRESSAGHADISQIIVKEILGAILPEDVYSSINGSDQIDNLPPHLLVNSYNADEDDSEEAMTFDSNERSSSSTID